METWQVYATAVKVLSASFLQKLYTRSYSLIKSWAAGPWCEKRNRNPLDRIILMLRELDIHGRGDVARAACDIMCEPLGGRFAYFPDAETDKGSIDGEAADATIALGDLVQTCRSALADGEVNGQEKAEIIESLRTVQNELNQMLDVVQSSEKG